MKKQTLLAALVLGTLTAQAQNKHTAAADQLFDSYQYVAAISAYKTLAESDKADGYVYQKLADSYYQVHNLVEAEKWYAKAVLNQKNAETHYRYAQTLLSQGKYDQAKQQLDAFAKLAPSDARAKSHLANPNYVTDLQAKVKLFDVAITNVNSDKGSDFGAVLGPDNQLYFASNRQGGGRTDKWSDQPYLDIYTAVRQADGSFSPATPLRELNTAFHDGPVALSADGNTMYFARDGHAEGAYTRQSKIKIGQQGLYKAVKVDGKWSNVQALPFNSTDYSVSHPALSIDGKTLYFASNKPGGLGDTDIWKVSVSGDQYGEPVNLGPAVNTPGKEGFPYVDEKGIVYFSSVGRQGLGGLDIYKWDPNAAKEAVNLGAPVNSASDDFAFSFHNGHQMGYFSSNRSGSDNIYQATPVCQSEGLIVVRDAKSKSPLANAEVRLLDAKQKVVTTERTNSKGELQLNLNCQAGYTFIASSPDYEPANHTLDKQPTGTFEVALALEPVEVIITETEVVLNPILFAYDKSHITSQGATELDKLVKVMQKNPTMVILVKSHTDTKGSAAYNLKLSEQRAQSTVQYIVSKGINASRISGKGYGLSEPKVNCGGQCTDEQDALNRRSEFIIVRR